MPAAKPSFPVLQRGHPLAQGLVGAWPLCEGSGPASNDLSGRGSLGTLGPSTTWGPGWYGHGLATTGTVGNGLQIPVAAGVLGDPSTNSLTMAVEVLAPATSIGLTQGYFSIREAPNGFALSINTRAGGAFGVEGYGSGSAPNLRGTTTPGENSFLLCYTWDAVAAVGVFYVNGRAEATNGTAPQSFIPGNVYLGSFGTDFDGSFVRSMAFGLLYNRALSAAEIAALYYDSFAMYRRKSRVLKPTYFLPLPNGRAKPSFPTLQRGHPLAQGLVVGWPLYEGSGPTANDVSGQDNTGTLSNTSVTWVGSDFGRALSFNGGNVRSALNLPILAPPYTLACLFRCDAGNDGLPHTLVTIEGTPTYLEMDFRSGNTKFRFTSVGKLESAQSVTDSLWHLGVGVAASASSYAVYLDGVAGQTGSGSVTASQRLLLGEYPGGFDRLGHSLANVMVWNRALSANEVAALYADSFAMYRRRSWRLKSSGSSQSVVPLVMNQYRRRRT